VTGAGPHPGFLRAFAETRAFLLGRPQRAQPTPDGRAVLFLRSPARVPELGLFEYDVATGVTRELVTPAQVLAGAEEVLTEAEKARRERLRITDRGFTGFALAPDGGAVLLTLSGRLFLVDRATGRVRALTPAYDEAVLDARFSPDGRRVAFVRGHDLWVVDLVPEGGAPRPVTTGGTATRFFGVAEFVAQEEMHRYEGYFWAPDGARLAVTEVDEEGVERFAIADPARPERPPVVFAYPRPGKANARVRLGIFPADGSAAAPVWADWDRDRYPYLARVLWDTPRAPLALLVQTRDQREAVLLTVDERTGATAPLVVERDHAWVNLDRALPRFLPDGSGLLWLTEQDGAPALELRGPDGAHGRTLVGPGEGFLGLLHVQVQPEDGRARALHVLLGDAIGNRIVRLSLDDGARVALTDDEAEHAPTFAAGGGLLVDTVVAADAWPRTRVLDATGRVCGELPQTAEDPPTGIALELTTVDAAGETFHAALVRPRVFDPDQRYPVVVHVYGGPHALTVKRDARAYAYDQWLADHGVIVVCIDNRGTPRRGRAFERAVKGRFGDVPLDDQACALEALGIRYPELDLGRVGVYGWSFGGYMAALAVLRRPELYQVAVAGAPVVDWHDYDTHYTERYLDRPEAAPEAYRSSSLLTYADGLRRPLLLVHGTADDNVYFFHSLKLADALLRAGRPFDFLPLPRVTHQIGDPALRERVWAAVAEYLLRHLGVAFPQRS
jgi:dipeptidyl-peptidase-4